MTSIVHHIDSGVTFRAEVKTKSIFTFPTFMPIIDLTFYVIGVIKYQLR